MNDLIQYTFEQETVRVVLIGDEPWWVATDVARVLGYKQSAFMTRLLDSDEKGLHIVQTLGGDQDMNVISESGLFAAILKSRKPEAKRFRRWVTGEVLPSIRRTGRYEMFNDPPQLPSPAIDDAELPRLNAAIGIMREARQVWGREECRRIWIRVGLPSPIAEASGETDTLALRIDGATRDSESVIVADLAASLGMAVDTKSSLRLGAALRLLGWASKKERVEGVPRYVWRRIQPIREAVNA
jgi:prophage antirepressor-like protein